MPSVSGRAVRRVVGDTLSTLTNHAEAIRTADEAIGVLTEHMDILWAKQPPDGLWARLKWLVRG